MIRPAKSKWRCDGEREDRQLTRIGTTCSIEAADHALNLELVFMKILNPELRGAAIIALSATNMLFHSGRHCPAGVQYGADQIGFLKVRRNSGQVGMQRYRLYAWIGQGAHVAANQIHMR